MFDWLSDLGSSSSDSPGSEDRSEANREWIEALEGPNPDPEALEELRQILVRGLRAALSDRVPRRADALAEDFAQEALLKILDKVDTFRGESKFTTWAQKIAVRTAFTELRRKRWENVSLDEVLSDADEGPTMPDVESTSETAADPEEMASQELLTRRVQQAIEEALTDRQRKAMTAVMQEMPLEEVARRMDTNRNALYKLIHDARQNLKAALEDEGITADQLLAELG
jgi:RNA polymerase sigma-70 factor (ECF subfamily)